MTGSIILIVIIAILAWLVVSNVRVVPQSEAWVLERLGHYLTTWTAGLHLKVPILDRIAMKHSLKEYVIDFQPQPVITSDNAAIQVDSVVYYQVTDPKATTYGVANPLAAIENLTATTLRNIIGSLKLDEALTSRDKINAQIRIVLDEATDPWGIKVNRVELKNILPPRALQDAMNKQKEAEQNKRQLILGSEGKRESDIQVAEGEKRSAVLRAEALKETQILEADGAAQAQVIQATAQAQAILKIAEATARSLEMINGANPNTGTLTLKALETFTQVANGQATKIIIPSQLQDLSGLLASLQAVGEKDKLPEAK